MSTCREKFNNIFMVARKCGVLVGADVFNPNYRFTFMTYFVIAATNTFFILSGYTIYVAIYIDHDWTAILQALCMVGSAVQGMSKLYTFTQYQVTYRKIFAEVDEVYEIYQEKKLAYQNALNDTTSVISKFLKFNAGIYLAGTSVIISVPIFYLVLYGEKIFIMQFLIPGIDPKTDIGHLMLLVAHSTCILMGSFGNFAGDMYFFMFLLQVPLLKNILKVKFDDLNEVTTDNEINNTERTLPLLKDILSWHQKYSDFTQTLSDVYFTVLFIQTFTTSFNIGMTIFITFMGVWPAGYAYLVYSFIMLYTYCGMGTVTEISNDNVCEYVYNTCLWYRLSVGERKMLIIMMMKAQNPTLLTVGDIMPLSVTTGLSLTKTIYSFLMMLLNFTEE